MVWKTRMGCRWGPHRAHGPQVRVQVDVLQVGVEQAQRKVQAVAARRVVARRVRVHGLLHATLQSGLVHAAPSPQHAPQGPGAQQWPLALLGHDALARAQEGARAPAHWALACTREKLGDGTVA